MILNNIEQFKEMPLGKRLHKIIDSHHYPVLYAGINPKVGNGVMLINGGDYMKVETITMKGNDTYIYLSDDYEESKQEMLRQAENTIKSIKEIYLGQKDENKVG